MHILLQNSGILMLRQRRCSVQNKILGCDWLQIPRVTPQMTRTSASAVPTHSEEMPVKQISSTITFHSCDNMHKSLTPTERNATKPLLLLLPWLGSRSHAVSKYREVYFQLGFDVLTVESKLIHFLWPRYGLSYAAEVLSLLQQQTFSSRPLFVHCFSVGGYTFTQMLRHMTEDPQQYAAVMSRIKGHIYDSLVIGSLQHMAVGVAQMIHTNPMIQLLLKRSTMLYFSTLKGCTVDYYDTAVNLFWKAPLKSPALFFYCENDVLSDHVSLKKLLEVWRQAGVSVFEKGWKKSIHAGHLRTHQQQYLDTLHHFLQGLQIQIPLKSKL
ncbi:uncharacterized protein LOC122815818 [Protopterus annectens]|uniref:uncharacterized protein LOC122815818 n=1 Tax=Protopterus annectens TaxID=7888 RepID=UPI001CFA1DED|nr:uncharacterized protein LOC122815818 [Protopterus annectens]